MNQSMIVRPYLTKASCDLTDATEQLGACWAAADTDAIARLTTAAEALTRAVASVSLAVERLAELVVEP
ncbi:MAG TPA: hypothetical protein VGJ60_34100 [Chloroflexota bacterium]|jgi:hypothetical protein